MRNESAKTAIQFGNYYETLLMKQKREVPLNIYFRFIITYFIYFRYLLAKLTKLSSHCLQEFKMRCDVCGGAHFQDEISAPER